MSIGYLPRGPVYFPGSWDDQEAEKSFWRAIHDESRKRGAIFLKVEPNIALSEATPKGVINARMAALGFRPSGRLQPSRTWVLDIDRSEDDLLKGMKPKTRYNLRLVQFIDDSRSLSGATTSEAEKAANVRARELWNDFRNQTRADNFTSDDQAAVQPLRPGVNDPGGLDLLREVPSGDGPAGEVGRQRI